MRRSFEMAFSRPAGAGAMAVVFYTALPLPVRRQRAAPPRIPRVAGKPDLNGIWQALNTANWDLEPHMARPALAMRPGPIVPVPAKEVLAFGAVGSVPGGLGVVEGGEIPYTPEARKKKEENQANWLQRDPEIKCYLPGVPRANYMPFPFQIFQSDKAFAIAYEYAGAYRNIYLKDPGPPQVDSWMGQSVGRWEGDTFVVDANGFNDQSWFDRAGNHHSESLKVTERYTMTDRGSHPVRSDDRGSADLHAAVEDQHAALSPREQGRAARPVQVRRVRRRVDVRPPPQGASEMRRCTRSSTCAALVFALRRSPAPQRSRPVTPAGCDAASRRRGHRQAVDDAAHAGRQARPAGQLEQRDASRRSSALGKQALILTEDAGRGRSRTARRQVAEFRDAAERSQSPAAGQGRRAIAPCRPASRRSSSASRQAAGGTVGGYNNVLARSGRARRCASTASRAARSSSIRPMAACRRSRRRRASAWPAAARRRRSAASSIIPSCAALAERCMMSFGSNAGPADAAELLLQQQLPDRADQGSRDDHDGDGARRRASSASAEPQHPPKQRAASGSATRSAGGKATRSWSRRRTSIRCSSIRGASENLKVTERFTRTGPDTIIYQFTIEDPTTFTAPWTGELPFNRDRRA